MALDRHEAVHQIPHRPVLRIRIRIDRPRLHDVHRDAARPESRASSRAIPRRFDPDEAVATAQHLFHARGYDAVSVAEVTEALSINRPSFYAAFGKKAGLYARILDRYAGAPAPSSLRTSCGLTVPWLCLVAVLEEAVSRYAADPAAAGCLVLEGTRCNNPEALAAARAFNLAAEGVIRHYIAAHHREHAEGVTDFICTTMSELSAKTRNGHGVDQILATAHLVGLALVQALPD